MSATEDRIAYAAAGVAKLAVNTLADPVMRADSARRDYLEGLLTAFVQRMMSETPLTLLTRWHSDDYDSTQHIVGLFASEDAARAAIDRDKLDHKDAGWKWDTTSYVVLGR